MKFHSLKFNFFIKGLESKEIIMCRQKEDLYKNVLPSFYIEHDNTEHLFGNIYFYNNNYYILLSLNTFSKASKFHYYKMCKFHLDEYNDSFSIWSDYSNHPQALRNQQEVLNNVFEHGTYLANIYLNKDTKLLRNIMNDMFIHFNKKLNISKRAIVDLFNTFPGYEEDYTYEQNDINLIFDKEILNLTNDYLWDKLYDYKDKDFEVEISLYNRHNYQPEGELEKMYKEKGYVTYLENKEYHKLIVEELNTGSFIVGHHLIQRALKDLNALTNTANFTIQKNSIHSITFNEDEKLNNLHYFKEMYLCIESGYPVLKSLSNIIYDERPLISLFSDYYEHISKKNSSEDNYLKQYLKLI